MEEPLISEGMWSKSLLYAKCSGEPYFFGIRKSFKKIIFLCSQEETPNSNQRERISSFGKSCFKSEIRDNNFFDVVSV